MSQPIKPVLFLNRFCRPLQRTVNAGEHPKWSLPLFRIRRQPPVLELSGYGSLKLEQLRFGGDVA